MALKCFGQILRTFSRNVDSLEGHLNIQYAKSVSGSSLVESFNTELEFRCYRF